MTFAQIAESHPPSPSRFADIGQSELTDFYRKLCSVWLAHLLYTFILFFAADYDYTQSNIFDILSWI